MKTIAGIYIVALSAALIAMLSGPLYGVVPPIYWIFALCLQGAIGGMMIYRI